MSESWIDRAKEQMRALGVSHQSLAERLGCTRGAIGHYLSGRRSPSLRQMSRIARALQVAPAWLLHGDPPDEVREQAGVYAGRDHLIPILSGSRTGRRLRQTGHLPIPALARNCYALRVTDDSCSPRFYAGEILLIDPGATPSAGDEVLLQRRVGPHSLHTYIKTAQGRVTVDSISGRRNRMTFRDRDIRFMHRIIAIFRAGEESRTA